MAVILGLTGGTGCGKSTVATYWAQCGAAIVDADRIAREIVMPGKPALAELAAAFDDILCDDGSLNRKKLGALAFEDPQKLHILNRITHTYIIQEIKNRLTALQATPLVVIDAPLLLECNLDNLCTACVAVLADTALRSKRIMARDGLTAAQAEARIQAQPEDSFYQQRCRFILYNNSDKATLLRAADGVLEALNS